MNYSWELIVLVCVYITFLGSEDFSVVAEEEGNPTLEPNFSKPPYVYAYDESTTESSSRKKHNFSELKNNNMLRDKNAQSLVTDNVKSFLEVKRNPVLNKSDVASANLDPVQIHRFTTVSSDTDHAENITPNNGLEENTGTQSVPVPSSTPPNQTIAAANRANNFTMHSPPPTKNPKDKDRMKPKIDPNSKQFKKTSSNFKNKSPVITNNNVSIESVKPENITEYSTDEAIINDTMTTDNVTNIVPSIDGTSEHTSSNATVSSLQTLPQPSGWAPLTLILIGVGVIALISIIIAIGMFSVVLYKRYHWNKPQTFSDKCSNADSTGYIDDSTLKENSEEMYSLDNDSFLNSLEAMTIQNYWADSIRHTKL